MTRSGFPMHLRPYHSADAEALAWVFRDAVTRTGATAYDPAQVAVWVSSAADLETFRHRLGEGLTLLALDQDRPVAFAQLHPEDHLELLYTASAAGRRGYATALYAALEAHARARGVSRLHTEASRIACPFFCKMGFAVVAVETVVRHGVAFERIRMAKWLTAPPPAARAG